MASPVQLGTKARTKTDTTATTDSATLGLATLGECFAQGEDKLRLRRDRWSPTGKSAPEDVPNQEWLVRNLPTARALAKLLGTRGIFSPSADVINKFLASEGFSIKLDPLGPDEYGMAGVLKLALKWLEPGSKTMISTRHGKMVGVKLPAPRQAYMVRGHHHRPVVIVKTMDGKKILLTEASESMRDLTGPALFDVARAMYAATQDPEVETCECLGVVFPRTVLDVQPKIKWMLGMGTVTENGQPAVVTQAVQQVKLVLDEDGAIVEEASAVATKLEAIQARPEPVRITDTFLAAIIAPGEAGEEIVALPFIVKPSAWTKAADEATEVKAVAETPALPEGDAIGAVGGDEGTFEVARPNEAGTHEPTRHTEALLPADSPLRDDNGWVS